MIEKTDHYEEVLEVWRKRSREWDWEKRFKELGLSGYTKEKIVLDYYGTPCQWDPQTGRLFEEGAPERKMTFSAQMNIYNLICREEPYPKLSGRWIPLREVKRAYPFAPAFQAATLIPFAKFFDRKIEYLKAAGQALGFRNIKESEAGLEAQVFSCLPIRFLFWDGDDEFPAQANILFDANVTEFLHEESVVMIGQDGAEKLIKKAEERMKG